MFAIYINLVILFQEKNVKGYETEPSQQVRTRVRAMIFLLQLPFKENYAIQAFRGIRCIVER